MQFNRYMVVLAREARQMTQSELAKLTKMSQGKISKIEHGLMDPSQDEIRTFANALEFPESFFTNSAELTGFPPYHFRRRKKLSAKSLDYIRATMNIMRLRIAKLVQETELESSKT